MRVFLVDDSLIIRKRLIKILTELEQVQIVGEAAEPRDAVKNIVDLKPDVVILDLQLINGTGFDVLEEIKNHQPKPVIIILTNFPYPEYRAKCLESGADYFFDKSTSFFEIPPVFANLSQHSQADTSATAIPN